jgi:hypothetical protein
MCIDPWGRDWLLARSSDDPDLEKIRRALQRLLAIRCGVATVFAALGYWLFYQLTHIGA